VGCAFVGVLVAVDSVVVVELAWGELMCRMDSAVSSVDETDSSVSEMHLFD